MVGVVPDTGAGDEVVLVNQLRLSCSMFDDLLQFVEQMFGDLNRFRSGLDDSFGNVVVAIPQPPSLTLQVIIIFFRPGKTWQGQSAQQQRPNVLNICILGAKTK